MTAASILALDIASTTGWCCGVPGAVPRYGSHALRASAHAENRHGILGCALDDFLRDMLRLHRPAVMVVEAPLIGGQHRGMEAAALALGLSMVARMVAHDHDVRFRWENVGTTRKAVLGRGTFPKGEAKPAAMAWCRAQGFAPGDDNAADSLVLWHHAAGLFGTRKIAA